jgi:hypothetical protein
MKKIYRRSITKICKSNPGASTRSNKRKRGRNRKIKN